MGKKKHVPETWQTGTGNEHFTPLYDSLIESPVFLRLTKSQKLMLITIYSKYKGNFTGNVVECRYKEFHKMGIKDKTTISKGLEVLAKSGFIEIVRGHFVISTEKGGKLYRDANKYKLLNSWQFKK